ncbi:DUF2267 domain-containing protein [Gracilimonas sp. Q87]|uniref:DUF2267 domain-containing protein n=1 Tax=Gracilimonas sp. Q87 TaxID=3384766 RepID=UPI00398401C7
MNNLEADFDQYIHETKKYINKLSSDLGHPEEEQRVFIVWRAVMHTIRDRIHMGESMDLLSALPMILKGHYTMGWKYNETPPYEYDTIEGMKIKVKALQNQYGEADFDWKLPTEDIISITIDSLRNYLSEDHMEHLRSQLPKEISEKVV